MDKAPQYQKEISFLRQDGGARSVLLSRDSLVGTSYSPCFISLSEFKGVTYVFMYNWIVQITKIQTLVFLSKLFDFMITATSQQSTCLFFILERFCYNDNNVVYFWVTQKKKRSIDQSSVINWRNVLEWQALLRAFNGTKNTLIDSDGFDC